MGTREDFFCNTADQSLAHEFTSFYFLCNEHCHPSAFILKALIFSVSHLLWKLITFRTKLVFFLIAIKVLCSQVAYIHERQLQMYWITTCERPIGVVFRVL
jgi:hypothetical protein